MPVHTTPPPTLEQPLADIYKASNGCVFYDLAEPETARPLPLQAAAIAAIATYYGVTYNPEKRREELSSHWVATNGIADKPEAVGAALLRGRQAAERPLVEVDRSLARGMRAISNETLNKLARGLRCNGPMLTGAVLVARVGEGYSAGLVVPTNFSRSVVDRATDFVNGYFFNDYYYNPVFRRLDADAKQETRNYLADRARRPIPEQLTKVTQFVVKDLFDLATPPETSLRAEWHLDTLKPVPAPVEHMGSLSAMPRLAA